MSAILQLTTIQYQQLQQYRDIGQYADAYSFMKDIVQDWAPSAQTDQQALEYQALANWLDRAASINSNDGSWSSEFVRGATESIGSALGRPITEEQFQDASDALARDVINNVLDNDGIPSAKDI